MYWWFVEAIYLVDVLIFAYLAFYFWNARKKAADSTKLVVTSMAVLTTVLALQELFFGVTTIVNPARLAYATELFPLLNDWTMVFKLLVTVAGVGIAYTVWRLKKGTG